MMSQPSKHSDSPEPSSEEVSGGLQSVPDSTSVRPDDSGHWTLGRSDQAVAMVLAIIVLLLLALQWGKLSGWGADPIEVGELPPIENQFRLDVNSATSVEWSQLDRIGEVLAERIVQDRNTNGNFETIDDLNRVEGIGPQTLEQIRPWLTIKPSD